jgi:hypothetical protein
VHSHQLDRAVADVLERVVNAAIGDEAEAAEGGGKRRRM